MIVLSQSLGWVLFKVVLRPVICLQKNLYINGRTFRKKQLRFQAQKLLNLNFNSDKVNLLKIHIISFKKIKIVASEDSNRGREL